MFLIVTLPPAMSTVSAMVESVTSLVTPAIVSDLSGPARYFLDHARVALSSGHVFGTGGQDHVRLNFATNPQILTQAITRLGQSLSTRSTAMTRPADRPPPETPP